MRERGVQQMVSTRPAGCNGMTFESVSPRHHLFTPFGWGVVSISWQGRCLPSKCESNQVHALYHSLVGPSRTEVSGAAPGASQRHVQRQRLA
jgi:hypothetical protein